MKQPWIIWVDNITGAFGCLIIDTDTHGSCVTKFSWYHSRIFHHQWTHKQVFPPLSRMPSEKMDKTYWLMWCNMYILILYFGIICASCNIWIDTTWWNKPLLWVKELIPSLRSWLWHHRLPKCHHKRGAAEHLGVGGVTAMTKKRCINFYSIILSLN